MTAFFKGIYYELLMQIWCQHSKAYRMAEKEIVVFLWGSGFAGLFVGALIAWPHYLFYVKWLESLLLGGKGAVLVATIIRIFLEKILPLVVVPSFLYTSELCWYLFLLRASEIISNKLFNDDIGWLGLCVYGGVGIPHARMFEVARWSVSFCFSFIIFISRWSYNENNSITRKFKEKLKPVDYIVTRRAFAISQRATLTWCPLLVSICYAFLKFGWWIGLNEKLAVIGIGFLVMPLLFLRFTDYIFCQPICFFQRFRVTRKKYNTERLINYYENSPLFKHEMVFGELFGLSRKLNGFVRNGETVWSEQLNKSPMYSSSPSSRNRPKKPCRCWSNYRIRPTHLYTIC